MIAKSERQAIAGCIIGAAALTISLAVGTWVTTASWCLGFIAGMIWITYWQGQE